jgi:L-threonylcarbamoyladenylate synthase
MIVDGGPSDVGIESTIVAFTGATPMLLRPGGIAANAIARVLGSMPRGSEAGAPRASGTLASHYAPRTQAMLVEADRMRSELEQLESRDERVAVLARALVRPNDFEGHWLQARPDASAYAHDLYANLRTLDRAGADVIVIEAVPEAPDWLAIRDRLARATRGDDDDRD